MLIRVSLIIAIVAALAVGVLNFVQVKGKIETLKTERDDWHGKFTKTDEDLTRTKGELDKTSKDLEQTKTTLATTTEERDKARAEAETATKRAADLTDRLAKATEARDVAQQELQRYKVTGYTPEQILAVDKVLKQTQTALDVATQEKVLLVRQNTKIQNELDKLTKEDYRPPPLPVGLKGKVLASDPKWEFVILNVGADQGVLEDGELLVNRNGKLVAKIRVQSVQKDRCVANLVPGWKLGEVYEGDLVIPAS